MAKLKKAPASFPRLPPKSLEPPREEDNTVLMFIDALKAGAFDTDLDTLYEAIDSRIVKYQQENGEPGQDPRERGKPSNPPVVIPAEGQHYYVRGEKYAGVEVAFLELQQGRALVEVIMGNNIVYPGRKYRIPVEALEEIPDKERASLDLVSKKTPYGYSSCKSCGTSIEYSGKGRPKSLCSLCEFHKK